MVKERTSEMYDLPISATIIWLSIVTFPMGYAASFSCPRSEWEQTWCDPQANLEARAEDLLSRLTVEERIQQLQTTHHSPEDPQGSVPRLHLETYTTGECLHGVIADNVTVFPQSINLASTFDVDLVGRVATAIGKEVRGRRNAYEKEKHNSSEDYWNNPSPLVCFSPQINLAIDPRWGRSQETYGASPFLTGTLARTYVQNLQGTHSRYIQAVATPKHFSAFGGRTSNGSYPTGSPTDVTLSLRDWAETFLTAFEQVLDEKEAGNNYTAASVMCSYNTLCQVDEYNNLSNVSCPAPSFGVPACASKGLLHQTLRNTWNFSGYVIGDDGAIKYIQTDHHWAHSQPQAASDALSAGVDMVLGGGCSEKNIPKGCISYGALPEALHSNLVSENQVDVAVKRILRVRFRLGLMDDPVKLKDAMMSPNPYEQISPDVVNSPAHRALAREAARKSVVLLKNGDAQRPPVLPLQRDKRYGKIAVVGPNANVSLPGNYNGKNANMSTMLDGIKTATARPILYAEGSAIEGNDTSGFPSAIHAAKEAEVTICFIGISQAQEHEGGKRASIELPKVQKELLAAVGNASKKLIVVIVSGSAVTGSWAKNNANAVLWAGYGGEEAGNGFAEVLFGGVSPSGKMPFTFYAGDYQLPDFGDYNMRGTAYGGSAGRTFRFLTTPPLWYFGFGLGYSQFEMSRLNIIIVGNMPEKNTDAYSKVRVPACSGIKLHFTLEEVANFGGAEVVQAYISRFDPASNPNAVRVSLAGFKRVFVDAKQKVNVSIEVQAKSLAEVVLDTSKATASWMWTPGKARIWIGGRMPTVEEIGQEEGLGEMTANRDYDRITSSIGEPHEQKLLYTELSLAGEKMSCPGFHEYQKVLD